MTTTRTQRKTYTVQIVNTQSVGTNCGHAKGRTLAEATAMAMEQARREYGDARYDGYSTVFVSAPVRL